MFLLYNVALITEQVLAHQYSVPANHGKMTERLVGQYQANLAEDI